MAKLFAWWTRIAPVLAPLGRLVGERRMAAALHPLEQFTKGALFDCRMCGQCVLSATGMTCPTNCAKRMRNGPCGGVRADGGCEVDPAMRCVWLEADEGDARQHRGHGPTERPRLEPIDARRQGLSTWVELVTPRARAAPTAPTAANTAPPPAFAQPVSALEAACRDGRFVYTVEIAPPDSHEPAALVERARAFAGLVDAINITDAAGANCHMSSVAAASVLRAHGLEAVCQVACRDRNRIALQGDVLGAAALGVRNVLCLTGDDVSQGDHPEAKASFDLDAVNLLHVLQGMRERAQYASGRKLAAPVPLFLGASANPFVPPYAQRVANLERKIDAGARFIQTQFCFDLPRLESFMAALRERDLHRRAAVIVGVGTLSTARALRWMAAHVPGVHVPEPLLQRIDGAADPRAEGVRACIETVHALQRVDGVAGVHLMGHRNEASLVEVLRAVRAGASA
ncbi:MAG: methylenetetrahydrofolate reductase C-terminal domain-containing protein [Burkholderiaceae bacterium]